MFDCKKYIKIILLPAILAAVILIMLPVLQVMHIAECECGGCTCPHARKAIGNAINKYVNTDNNKICTCNQSCKKNKNSRNRKQKHHDPSTCPFCQMHASITGGFLLINSQTIVKVSTCLYVKDFTIKSFVTSFHYSNTDSRAPPFI